MEILIKALQLISSLAILILIHELGHFIPSKLFKIRVDKFYLFFDPWFSLFKFKRKDTEYGIGWLPLGGYCKISGMIDESMDKEQMKQPPQPWEFRSKPTWQRLIVMLGGVTMNLVLAILIYIVMLSVWGEEYLPTANVKYGITVDATAEEMGLRNGDKILSLDNKVVEDFYKITAVIILDNPKTIQVERDGKKLDITIPNGTIAKIIKNSKKSADLIGVRIPFEVGSFTKDSPGKTAGLKEGDKLIGINDVQTNYFDEFRKEIVKHKNQQVVIIALRLKDTIKINLKVPNDGLIGIGGKNITNYFTFSKKEYSIFEAIPAGTVKAYNSITNYIKQLRLIFSPETKAYESLGGFIAIGNIFPAEWHWQSFWGLTAFLSVILAIMNVLPIPALDGGHVLFLLYEIITRRKPSDKFMEYAQIVGMVILLGLLVYANGNDIVKLFR
ncbi:MAG: RIP metalloprotease RseP [Bacteroidetes bacterium CG2_30_32_10]|nr:MAG: RIP metalloprotease RseP [Bacteroidetes bacterium CG2_30_32_10]